MTFDPSGRIKSLDVDTCWDLLADADLGRLALAVGGEPDIFPVNFVVDGRSIVIRTAEGTKLVEASMGGIGAFEIDGFDSATDEAWSVVARGPVEVLREPEAVRHAEALPIYPWGGGYKVNFVRVTPLTVTGMRFVVVPPGADEN
jgi:nitroimidazol reductase NimA-like FMN-containing flavoprotein (pyridoxamine 5'-phosphate oxidase superfamily)